MPVHAMIDLETLGTKPDCTVLTIGGIKFDPNTKEEPWSEFYMQLDIDDQERMGRSVDDDTLEWWGKQDPEIIEAAFTPHNRILPKTMLQELKKWCVGVDTFWAQGVSFDIVIIENMCRMYDIPIPWPFWKVKDSRTLLGIVSMDPRKRYTFAAHNALEDCRIQAKSVQDAIAELGIQIR
jgi:DNA polymerase III epsilon subunit-like protein